MASIVSSSYGWACFDLMFKKTIMYRVHLSCDILSRNKYQFNSKHAIWPFSPHSPVYPTPLLAAASAAWWSHQSHAPVEGCRSPAALKHGKVLGELGHQK
jgi:hypothetical protein